MKKIIILFLIVICQDLTAQTKLSEIEKNTSISYIWGLLKYLHPEISKGKLNWDKEFVKIYDKVEKIENTEQFNQELLAWIMSFENTSTKQMFKKTFYNQRNLFRKNSDFTWIEKSSFDATLKSKLNEIAENSNFEDYYASINKLTNFIEFKNEKGFENFDFKIKSNRILFLASFWNVMIYWNVNIYLTDESWNEVLKDLQVDFINANTEEKFEFAKMKLFSKLNDSHSNYETDYFFKNVFNRFASFGGKIVNDSLVVINLYSKKDATKDNIKIKDVICKIENKSVKEYFEEKFKNFGSSSNLNYSKHQNQYYWLLSSNKDSLQVQTFNIDKKIETKYIKLNKLEDYINQEKENIITAKPENFYELNINTGYINLDRISKNELKKAFELFTNKKGIVIDLRNYPTNINDDDLSKYLYPEKKIFVKVLSPFKPSIGEYDMQAPLKLLNNPFSTGSKNSKYFKGKIVLLVNRRTLSKAEFLGMFIQQSPNCITIGEQTGGAVMNRIQITLSDKTTIDFTGMGAFYPNDIGVQRNGLKLDYEIKESAINFNPNKYIEEAIKLIEK
jgi:carboxyl-terminal processing protease